MRLGSRRAAAGAGLVLILGCSVPQPQPQPTASPPPVVPGSAAPSQSAGHPPASPPPASATPAAAGWTVRAVAPMRRARDGFRALVLGDDTVLVAGDDLACAPGGASPGSETAERYDPLADTWSATAPLNKPRKGFAMVPTLDGGALVAGGVNADDQPFSSTKRFIPATGAWTDGPLLRFAYPDPSAATLSDGRIYVVGPTIVEETSSTSTAEILAPGRDRWDDGGRLEGVSVRDLIRLTDGRLVALGTMFESPDLLFAHDSGGAEGWLPIARPEPFDFVEDIVAIPGGGMLAFGSAYDPATGGTAPQSALRHDPAVNRWVPTGPMLSPRTDALITQLADGRVLVAGGVVGPRESSADGQIVRHSEIYDPQQDAWSAGPELLEIRADGQAIALRDGSVLVLGGLNVRNVGGDTPFCAERLTSVERLTPTP